MRQKNVYLDQTRQRLTARLNRVIGASYSFFGDDDKWLYFAVGDDRTCEQCMQYEVGKSFVGAELLAIFPYLDIVDVDWIDVNIHPNCRCHLRRNVSYKGVEIP